MNKSIAWIVGLPCGVFILYLVTMCLWEYRLVLGAAMLLLIFLVVGVWIRGQMREQDLRVYRFNHREETPLDNTNMPMVLRPDMRENRSRQNGVQPVYYQGYQQD